MCSAFHFFAIPFPCSTGFVMKIDGRDLQTVAATYLGGTAAANVSGLAVDGEGYPYLTGSIARNYTAAADDYPVTSGAFQTSYRGTGNLPFVTRMTPELNALSYSTFLGGTKPETSRGIAVDGDGRAVVSGNTLSVDFPVTGVFSIGCGPQDPNFQGAGFVTRLNAGGGAVDSSAILDANTAIQFMEGNDAVVLAADDLVRVHMGVAAGPVAGCTVNGASYRREGFVGPGQLLTVMGGPFPAQTRLVFDGVPAQMIYTGATQLNAVVPREAAGRAATLMRNRRGRLEVECTSVRSAGGEPDGEDLDCAGWQRG